MPGLNYSPKSSPLRSKVSLGRTPRIDPAHQRSQGLLACWPFTEGGGPRVAGHGRLAAGNAVQLTSPSWAGPLGNPPGGPQITPSYDGSTQYGNTASTLNLSGIGNQL